MPRKKTLITVGVIIILVLIVALILSVSTKKDSQSAQASVAQGVAYLQSLENKNPEEIGALIRLRRQEELQAMKDDMESGLADGSVSVWSMYDDYLILGDSRTIGFSYYGFLPESNVWAETGATIQNFEACIPDLVAASPEYVYTTYGMNDFCAGIWDGPSDFTADYKSLIQQVQAALPDVKFVVCSVHPASEAAYDRANIWSVIPDYNAAIETMCSELDNCYFVNCDEISQQHMDLWESDGIHFTKDFYPFWAIEMIMEVYNNEIFIDDEDPSAA